MSPRVPCHLALGLLLVAASGPAHPGLLEEPLLPGDWTRPLVMALEPGTRPPSTRGEAAVRVRRRLERSEPDPECRIGLLAEAYRDELEALGSAPREVAEAMARICPPLPVSEDAGESHRTGKSRSRLQEALLQLDRLDRRIAVTRERADRSRVAPTAPVRPEPPPPAPGLWSAPSLLSRPDPEGWSPLFAPPPMAPRSP